MRPLMPPVQTPDNLFHDGNPLTGELGTIVDAEHLNNEQAAIRDTQSELIAILTAAAMEPESTAGQLLAALNKLYAPLNDTLGALSSLVGGANKLPYFTAANAAALTALSSIGRDIIGKEKVADVLTYLGLKSAAQRDVGTGANQIPDMASFAAGPGWMKFPSGKIIQYGYQTSSSSGSVIVNFPIPFPTQCFGVTGAGTDASAANIAGCQLIDKSGFYLSAWLVAAGSVFNRTTTNISWIAVGI
ncbi:gp53-like domain-containing protein [Enterobacter roggenkampii]|uniref:gp53-like domain-containing protein n=1 Tax=Enterobacter roggenkampii TaxID=1812935 RepID=UPI00123861AF|nr:hypothetical protein [Enterobacter roggenkampii]HCR0867119.1 hypothetical protein [Enterobacter roggenkampii]